MNLKRVSILAILLLATTLPAREYHVAVTGADANPGTKSKPFQTISAAANAAQPGDVITVHEGVYRERVNPPRGGSSARKRITYQAAKGEKVVITGSEVAPNWERVTNDTWKTTLPNSYFGQFNPYQDRIRGDWFDAKGRVHRTGCVYLNDDWFIEATELAEVMKPVAKTPLWYGTVDGDNGKPMANLTWLKIGGGPALPAATPSTRYGGRPVPCSEGGQCAGNNFVGGWLAFSNVDFGSGADRVEIRAISPDNETLLELRLDDFEGPLLGVCDIPASAGAPDWRTFSAKIQPASGRRTLCVVFKSPRTDSGRTTIYAQFPGVNPNSAPVEINKRQTVFYPSRNFINHITVRGFTLKNAASNWAPPSAEQTAIIGSNWSRDWIIENNTIGYSKCSGVALGKYGDGTDNTNDAGEADPYTACVRRALTNGWNKATIGGHTVRNNHIHHCEQTGVVGSMGCAFSQVIGNEIHDIHLRNLFGGAEMAGIKFHGAIDVVIRDNHIYRCGDISGVWLDWMAQGAQVTGNLLHDNTGVFGDIFLEMQHGPLLVANNLLLSPKLSFCLNSKGVAIAHNLITGPIANTEFDGRNTPYHAPHSTEIAGLYNAPGGDHRFHNNLFVAPCQLNAIDNSKLPCFAAGNVFTKGTQPSIFDVDALLKTDFDPGVRLEQRADGWYLTLAGDPAWKGQAKRQRVTTQLLGKARIPNLPYENRDGSPIRLNTDFLGKKRDAGNPFPGPIEISRVGPQTVKVWPKNAAH
jgi:hypothetical protein